jgi:hypothetical protein
MVTFENQKRSNFVLKDLSTITANKVIFLQEICGKIFTTPQIDNAGVVLVLYQIRYCIRPGLNPSGS